MRLAVSAFGLAMRMNSSKKSPVAPSARNHSRAGAGIAALAWPAPKGSPPLLAYIARSTTIGTVDWMIAETSAAARIGSSSSTQMLARLLGPRA